MCGAASHLRISAYLDMSTGIEPDIFIGFHHTAAWQSCQQGQVTECMLAIRKPFVW